MCVMKCLLKNHKTNLIIGIDSYDGSFWYSFLMTSTSNLLGSKSLTFPSLVKCLQISKTRITFDKMFFWNMLSWFHLLGEEKEINYLKKIREKKLQFGFLWNFTKKIVRAQAKRRVENVFQDCFEKKSREINSFIKRSTTVLWKLRKFSHTFLAKISLNQRFYYLNKLLKSWFDEIFL